MRVDDNSALHKACENSSVVIPIFIFDPRQIENNEYFSANAFQFMIQCLRELTEFFEKRMARLYLFQGKAEEIVGKILFEENIDAVYMNADYTPFSRHRDAKIGDVCDRYKADFYQIHDALINPPELVLKDDGHPYNVFTYFHKRAETIPIKKPVLSWHKNFFSDDVPNCNNNLLNELEIPDSPNIHLKGGRKEAIMLFDQLKKHRRYDEERDYPAIEGTTNLSAHLKFGTISVREAYRAVKEELGSSSPIIRQLYWRDFFSMIGFYYPHVFEGSFHRKFDLVKWQNNEDWFEKWKNGETGFPIVDAGMRQLNKTGYMHNRVRMITASFLTKDLHIDWRWGEKYFAQNLVDYDPAVNNGNWQWAASTGCDAQPYFRIFNPWLQQKKYDSECEYIKKWIPELEKFDSSVIHDLYNDTEKTQGVYPPPVIDHAEESVKAKETFKMVMDINAELEKFTRGNK